MQFVIHPNDGGLQEDIKEEDLKKVHLSKPRKPLIVDVCFKAGYIDSWGRGTIKILETCHEAGLPEPVLKEEQGGFLSEIFKTTGKLRGSYGETAENLVQIVHENPNVTANEMAQMLGKSLSTVEKTIRKLKKDKIIERIESPRVGYWKIL